MISSPFASLRNALTPRHFAAPLVLLALLLLTGCESTVQKYRELGIKQYHDGQYNESLTSLNVALSSDQFDAQSNAYAGLIEYRRDNYQQAAYYFKVALQADPSNPEAVSGLTAAYIKLGKPNLAMDFLERRSSMADHVKDPREEKSIVKRPYTKQTEENLYTGKVGARLLIGNTYAKLGDYDNALLYYLKALDIDSSSAQANFAIASLYDKTGNKTAARPYIIRAYTLDPATPGLTDMMTRNDVIINDVIGSPSSTPTTPTPPSTQP